jgi:hypothetical protein
MARDLFQVASALAICVVLFGLLSVRLAKRDKRISGARALVLVSFPILTQLARESAEFSFRLDFFLAISVAVALGYAMVAAVRCTQRKGAFAALLLAIAEVPLLATIVPYWLVEPYSTF